MKIVAVIVLLAAVAHADTLTLVNNETLNGEIVSETATEYRLRTANADYSITSVRVVPKSDVKAVVHDTPEQKAERAAYANLCRYRLNPDQEYTAAYYAQVIALHENFLANHRDCAHVRTRLAAWKGELAQLNKGLVKHNNRWMSAGDKKAAIALAAQQARFAAARKNFDTQTQRCADLEARHDNLSRDIVATTTSLEAAEANLANLHDFTEPVYEIRPSGGSPYAISTRNGPVVWSPPFWERYMIGERVTRHPLRAYHEQEVLAARTRLDRLQAQLDETVRDIIAARADLEKAKAAFAEVK